MHLRFRSLLSFVVVGIAVSACRKDDLTNPPGADPQPPRTSQSLGLVQITLMGVGTPQMTASVTPVNGSAGAASFALTPIPGGTPEGSIELRRVSATTVDVGTRGVDGVRYLQALFEVRNADLSSNAYSTPRQNLTFIPVGTATTISGTPVRNFLKQDGTPANPALAAQLRPTGAVALGGGGELVSQYPDVLQALTEAEAGAFTAPAAVTEKFPYGFVVRHATDSSTRTLPASPSAAQFDGRVTFAYKIPLQANPADDPFTISILALAVDDGETRVTQSPEEQTVAGQSAFEARASALSATEVTIMKGGRYSGSIASRAICSVRVGGTSAAPTTYIQEAGAATAVGSARYFTGAEMAAFCVEGGAAGAEYTFIPINTATSSMSLTVTGSGIATVTGPPNPNLVPGSDVLLGGAADPGFVRDDAFDLRLRAWERSNLQAGMRLKVGAPQGLRASFGKITLGVPAIGDLMQLNVAQGCSGAVDNRTGRVRAIGTNIIIIADTLNPPGGFTTAQYDSIRAEFDTIAYPAVTANFGTPTDIDANGRVVAFFTRAVNELSPPASSVVNLGYFSARDLSSAAGCERSNEGEMFYLMVPDPTGVVNSNVRTVSTVRGSVIRTLGHELQHLINASRRLHVTGAPLEDAWLDEGMSAIAEEMMFYHTSLGLAPRGNIIVSNINTGPFASRRVAAYNTYANNNFGQLRSWLQRPDTSGAFKGNGSLATRGVAWAFLRYAADRKGGTESAFWSGLVDGTGTGKANLQAVTGADPNQWLRDFVVAMYADDAVGGIGAEHQNASWNYRSMFIALNATYQLVPRPLTNGTPLTLSYSRDGGAAYVRFGVASNKAASFSVTSGSAAPPSTALFALMRTK